MTEHPFNVGLANNTLSIESFKFHIQRDTLFLSDYIHTVLITASKVENCNNIAPLIEVAQGAMAIMRILYRHYLAVYSINHGEKSLECLNFTNFLLSTSHNDTYKAITILYSCHLYIKVIIDRMKSKIKKNNRYKDWFDFYCDSLVRSGCIALESIFDECCKKVGEMKGAECLNYLESVHNLSWTFGTAHIMFQNSIKCLRNIDSFELICMLNTYF